MGHYSTFFRFSLAILLSIVVLSSGPTLTLAADSYSSPLTSSTSGSSLTISWGAVIPSSSALAPVTYELYRSPTSSIEWSLVVSTNKTSINDTGVSSGNTYLYHVESRYSNGNVGPTSNVLTVTASGSVPTPTSTATPRATSVPLGGRTSVTPTPRSRPAGVAPINPAPIEAPTSNSTLVIGLATGGAFLLAGLTAFLLLRRKRQQAPLIAQQPVTVVNNPDAARLLPSALPTQEPAATFWARPAAPNDSTQQFPPA